GIGAGKLGIESVHRRGLRDVERLALRHALGDVEHDDVTEFLQADQVSQRSADLAGANQSNLIARHGICPFERQGGKGLNGWLSLSRCPFKPPPAQLATTCVISGLAKREAGISHQSSRFRARKLELAPHNDGWRRHVSTNPVVAPLAAESLCPWGRAK